MNSRSMARPSSARPAPPKIKKQQEDLEEQIARYNGLLLLISVINYFKNHKFKKEGTGLLTLLCCKTKAFCVAMIVTFQQEDNLQRGLLRTQFFV